MELEQLEKTYWHEEAKLRVIASSHGVSVQYLTHNIERFEKNVRVDVASVLWRQVDLLEKILRLKRTIASSGEVVSLSSYRSLVC